MDAHVVAEPCLLGPNVATEVTKSLLEWALGSGNVTEVGGVRRLGVVEVLLIVNLLDVDLAGHGCLVVLHFRFLMRSEMR